MTGMQCAILAKLYEGKTEKELLEFYAQYTKNIGELESAIHQLSEYSRAVFALLEDLRDQQNLLAFISMQLTKYGYNNPNDIVCGKPEVKENKE